MQMFPVRICQDEPKLEPSLEPSPKLLLNDKLCENMISTKRFPSKGHVGDGTVFQQAQTMLDVVATMKRCLRLASKP